MKKIEIKGKLSLNKSTIASLNGNQMAQVKGGGVDNTADEGPAKSKFKHCHYPSCPHDGCTYNTKFDISCDSACIC